MREKKGEWFLPNSNLKLPGKLYVEEDNKRIILHLYSNVHLSGYSPKDRDIREDRYHEIILGKGINSLVTLYSCRWCFQEAIKDDFHEIKYKIEYVFDKILVKNSDKFLFKKISVDFPNIQEFFDGFKIFDDTIEEQYFKLDRKISINNNFK